MNLPRIAQKRAGSALVSTLLMIVVLTIIVVAFMQSMSVERKTARSYKNRFQAELSATAAQAEALAKLRKLMLDNPYHAIGYELALPSVGSSPITEAIPVFCGSSSATVQPSKSLLIAGNQDPVSPTTQAYPSNLTAEDSVALNVQDSDDAGWMGSPVSAGSINYRQCRVPWVYLLQYPTRPHQPDKRATNYNPYIARYAWWIEDETSKLDLLVNGNNDAPGGGYAAPETTNLADPSNSDYRDAVAWKSFHTSIDVAPLLNGTNLEANSVANDQLVTFRDELVSREAPRDARFLNRVPGFDGSEKEARFYTTIGSVSSELAGNGRRRINLNGLVHDESINASIIASDLDDIAFAIAGRHIFPVSGIFAGEPDQPSIALLSDFGSRFWPDSDAKYSRNITDDLKRRIYMTRIAANIRDYIDKDTNPTFVDASGNVFAGSDPGYSGVPPVGTFPSTPTNTGRNNTPQPYAIGKEAIPYLSKTGWSFSSVDSDLYFDQFFSFFNPATKDFTAPSGTFLRSYSRMPWNLGGFGQRQMEPFELDLSNVTFQAGRVTVITTSPNTTFDPRGGSYTAIIGAPGNVVRLPVKKLGGNVDEEGTRKFTGVVAAGRNLRMVARGGSHDWYAHMLWGNDKGYYGGYGGVGMTAVSNYSITGPNQFKSTVQTMRGNDAASHSGDARSIEEALSLSDFYLTGAAGGAQDQYRFYSSSSNQPLATAYNSYINPPGNTAPWPDYTSQFNNTINTSYTIVRDEPMTSIGELGHIYDPYRRNGNNTAGSNNTGFIDFARGGGRTLRIGQPDDVIVSGTGIFDAEKAALAPRFTAAWSNAAWRLTDVFDIIVDPTTERPNMTRKVADPQAVGKLNINSVLRDGGTVFRGLLSNFRFVSPVPHSDPNLVSGELSSSDIDTLVNQISSYLEDKGPIMERGELSQLPFFVTGQAAGRPMKIILDRGREEIFRRIIGLMTTRSNSFGIYAIGQAVREERTASGSYKVIPEATARNATVYRFDPIFNGQTVAQLGDSQPTATVTDYTIVPLYDRP